MQKEIQITLGKKRITIVLYRLLMLITILIMTASIVLFFLDKDKGAYKIVSEVLLCVCAMVCLSIPIFLERKFKIFIPNYILVVMFLFIFAHFVLGEFYRIYDHSLIFDKLLHTISGMIIAMLSYSIVSILNEYPKNKIKLSPLFLSIFAFCFTMTIEYLWEIFEYLMDTILGTNMQRWQDSLYSNDTAIGEYTHSDPRGSGLNDTMLDMIVNILGALTISIYGYVGMRINPESWIIDKVILTKENITDIKESGTNIELRPNAKRRRIQPLVLNRVKRVQKKYQIAAQRAERSYLRERSKKRSLDKGQQGLAKGQLALAKEPLNENTNP